MPTIGDTYIMALEYSFNAFAFDNSDAHFNRNHLLCVMGHNRETHQSNFELSKMEFLTDYLNGDSHLGYVTIPRDVSVVKDPNKNIWYTKEIYITDIVEIKDFDCWRNYQFCLNAVEKNGKSLKYVDNSLKTAEICLKAVQQHGYALRHVPVELKTKELCRAAVQQTGWALWYVPLELKTKELCLIAIRYNGALLCNVPDELKTEELCLIAVQQNKTALNFVPDAFKESCVV